MRRSCVAPFLTAVFAAAAIATLVPNRRFKCGARHAGRCAPRRPRGRS